LDKQDIKERVKMQNIHEQIITKIHGERDGKAKDKMIISHISRMEGGHSVEFFEGVFFNFRSNKRSRY
jgi:hypothetical protein